MLEDLSLFVAEATKVRKHVLAQQKWQDWAKRKWSTLRGKALEKKLWNAALTSLESELMKHLEALAASGVAGVARVCMPSYDGLLLHHEPGALDTDVLRSAWDAFCLQRYNHLFPMTVKDYGKDMPKWRLSFM